MKAPKNFEGVFVAAAILSTFAAYATAEVPVVQVAASTYATAATTDSHMQVVEVKAKRLTAVEKAAAQ